MISSKRFFLLIVAATLSLGLPATNAQQPSAPAVVDMTPVNPESVGFSSERLERLHAFIQSVVDKKELSGAVTILARHGKIVDYRTYGVQDFASGVPMAKETIFRDYSMTKPVTGVAMLILYEEGKWLPSDPISKFIPEFANLKVFAGLDADRQNDPRRSRSSAHHARADDPHRGLQLRRWRRPGRRDVPETRTYGMPQLSRR